MISLSECAALAGLASNELVLGASPSAKHRSLLSSYLQNAHRGLDTVRDLIVADLRRFLDLGVPARAADQLMVLRMLLTLHPASRYAGANFGLPHSEPFELARADADMFGRRSDAVVLTFARRRKAEHSEPLDFFDRPGEPIFVRRGSRPLQLRGER